MSKIEFEDRTAETPEQKLAREVFAAGELIAGFTIRVSGARPPVGLGALSFVLGMGAARTGADLEEVISAVRAHYDAAQEAMREEGVEPTGSTNDA